MKTRLSEMSTATGVIYLRNPSAVTLQGLRKRAKYHSLRGLVLTDGTSYWWSAWDVTHDDMCDELGLDRDAWEEYTTISVDGDGNVTKHGHPNLPFRVKSLLQDLQKKNEATINGGDTETEPQDEPQAADLDSAYATDDDAAATGEKNDGEENGEEDDPTSATTAPPSFTLRDVQLFADLRLMSGDDEETAVKKTEEKFDVTGVTLSPVGIVSVPGLDAQGGEGGNDDAYDTGMEFGGQDDPNTHPDDDPRKYLNYPEISTGLA